MTPPLAQTDPILPGLLMAAGALLAIVLVLVNTRRRFARRHTERLDPHERIERVKQSHGMRNDLREMMVELEDLTRRFGAQLDAKSRRLEKLLDEADRRITELRRLQEDSANGRPTSAGEPDPPDPLAAKIYERFDAGQDPVQIAGELNEHVGKVELILALRQR